MAAIVASALAAHAVVTIDTVPVGNPGNTGELSGIGARAYGPARICGTVAYTYHLGKYEVTNAQYCEFLNAKLPTMPTPKRPTYCPMTRLACTTIKWRPCPGAESLDPGGATSYTYTVKSGYENRPVTYVSWYDTVRFANWLQNGQGTGSTETGTYQTGGGSQNSGTVALPDRGHRATWTLGNLHWVLPSEDEWYKAAYHQNDGVTGNYWDYPTSTDDVPYSDNPVSLNYPANSANSTTTTVPAATASMTAMRLRRPIGRTWAFIRSH